MITTGASVDIPDGTVLGERQLNRALLARQHLLARVSMPVGDMLEHLVGMQSQVPNDPYIGLWSRLDAFGTGNLAQMMLDRSAVRASLMRGTIHLVTSADYLTLQPVTMPLHERVFSGTEMGRRIPPDAVDGIVGTGRELLRETPMTMKALGQELGDRFPQYDPGAMAQACRYLLPLVQTTPRGVWGASHQATWALAGEWLGSEVGTDRSPDAAVPRYLTAFGPATVADIQAWSGLQGLRASVERLRAQLRVFRNERGQELLDVPGAPLLDPEVEAPVRFLPGFDNVLLSHKDRARIISEERRKAIGSRNGLFHATYLVDGFVAGIWAIRSEKGRATLTLRPFERHSEEARCALEEEAERLLGFVHPDIDQLVRIETSAG